MNIELLEQILKENNQPKFRLGQIIKAVYQDGVSSFLEISNLPKDLREILNKEIKILSFEAEKVLVSENKDSIKALLKLEDGNKIETVLISPKPGVWSACISCQVGCPMNCEFCATGSGGFKRNLTAEEISDQVLFWKTQTPPVLANAKTTSPLKGEVGRGLKISNIVYMGMGEPFLNWEEVRESLKILTDPKGMNFGSRSISVSTVGIPGGMEKLTRDFPQINLAISLHFADDKKREKFMPANKNLNLEKLKNELEKYFEKSNRKVFLEYILFSKINDSEKDMRDLIKYIKSFRKQHLLHVNLIKYNPVGNNQETRSNNQKITKTNKFISSSSEQAIKFRNYLLQNKINCTIRKSLGTDIQGACGQLAQH
ncbi:MAG TPA: 23S rRNA (adenine(2503)-C(2))-methyltransferase RlmN [Candidatus Moranbacteria bacterium]|nr:23S rRNA (adenine(2503)-C(2))-methyltransferase RlmN [Candidatus Moranbacteria bacterium]